MFKIGDRVQNTGFGFLYSKEYIDLTGIVTKVEYFDYCMGQDYFSGIWLKTDWTVEGKSIVRIPSKCCVLIPAAKKPVPHGWLFYK